jgi:hypothetical protein
MEEHTNRPESLTEPERGETELAGTSTANEAGVPDAGERSTPPERGTTNREKSRTSNTDTWTVRGIDIETRRAAKFAAKREGKFLGDWLNETIRAAAHATLKGNTLPARQEDVTDALQRILDERLRPITEQLAALSARPERRPRPLLARILGLG